MPAADALAVFGPFFAVTTHPPGAEPSGRWRAAPDQETLRGRIAQVRATLAGAAPGSVEPKVAASVAQLGLAARLVSPALGAAVLLDAVPDLGRVWWQPGPASAVPVSVAWPEPPHPPDPSTGLSGLLSRLVELTQAEAAVSPRVLWGNVASAVNGAATVIAAVRPDLAPRAYRSADGLLAQLPGAPEGPAGPAFRRGTCCLIYRASPTGRAAICSDCVLTA